MCYLIHLGIPIAHAGSVQSPRSFRVAIHQNASVSAAFGPSFTELSVASGGCACELYSSPDPQPRSHDRSDARKKRYQRLGWSDAKIQRALLDSAEALKHRTEGGRPGIRDDVVAFLAELIDLTGQAKLIVHDYQGSFTEEHVTSSRASDISVNELQTGFPVAEDTVYTVYKRAS